VSALQRIVVVGVSFAGLRAVESLRKRGYDGALTLVGEEARAPYDRPPLSKQVLTGEWDPTKVVFRQKEGYEALALQQVLGQRAASLDTRERKVLLQDGRALPYDGVVIATGTRVRTLPPPMASGLAGVHTLRTLDDALALKRDLVPGVRVVVIGAGFIGLEVAASCRKLGLDVTVVEMARLPLAHLLGEPVGQSVQRMHEDHGVAMRLGVGVAGIEGAQRVERVRLTDGSVLSADIVVVGIGVTPATEWLQSSGVALDNGVVCDATCATNVPNVVAAGDVARFHNVVFDEAMRVEHWSNAVEQAQAAAARLLHGDAPAPPVYRTVPYFWSDQYDVKLQFVGRVRPDDQMQVVEGSLSERAFTVIYGRNGRLRGALTCNRPAQLVKYRKLLSEGAPFEVQEKS
jgi:3-phenylpropionate/trans-cinnamate dioxygenase ferredoxin reductase component